jgi:hypothetical protein
LPFYARRCGAALENDKVRFYMRLRGGSSRVLPAGGAGSTTSMIACGRRVIEL